MRPILALALLLPVAVAAAGSAQAQAFRGACHVAELCPGVERGGGRVVNCLREHRAELSEQCFAALGRAMLNRRGQGQGQGAQGPGGAGPGGPGAMAPGGPGGMPPGGPSGPVGGNDGGDPPD